MSRRTAQTSHREGRAFAVMRDEPPHSAYLSSHETELGTDQHWGTYSYANISKGFP